MLELASTVTCPHCRGEFTVQALTIVSSVVEEGEAEVPKPTVVKPFPGITTNSTLEKP